MEYFITGTDTDCGKTLLTCALLEALGAEGWRVAGFKPIAAGARRVAGELRNDDALALQRHANLALPYEWVNPYCFEPPIAPHIAARQAGQRIQFEHIGEIYHEIRTRADAVLIEGAGGWRVPLDGSSDMADLCAFLDLPVILVAEARLGWLNHSLLTVESILQRGLRLAGWIANSRQGLMPHFQANLESLESRIPAPLLGVVPPLHPASPWQVVKYLHVSALIG